MDASETILYLVPAAGVLALIFAFIKGQWIKKQEVGTPVMKEIADNIAEGATAFLNREYKVLAIFVLCVAVLLGVANQGNEQSSGLIALAFV